MKKHRKYFTYIAFVSLLLFVSGTGNVFSQSQNGANIVQGINPMYPSNDVWITLSSTAKPIAVAVPLGMLTYALIAENKKMKLDAFEAIGGLAIAAVTTELLKVTVKRPRPYYTYPDIYPDHYDDSYSFPSGHTSVAFATATSLSLTSKKWYVTLPAFAWASGVGYSRLYLGQHYPSDVIAGALVGAAGAYASHWLNKKIFRTKVKKQL